MRKKVLLRRLGWVFLFILVILVYLAVYFFPTIVDINRSKREVKDIKMKLLELERVSETILLTNKREKSIFRQIKRKFWSKFPKLKNKKDKSDFIQNTCDYIRESAAREKIKRLSIMTNIENPEVLFDTSLPGRDLKNVLLEQLYCFQQPSEKNPENNSKDSDYYTHFLETLSYLELFVAFEAELKNGARFINQLPHFSSYIKEEQVVIIAGKPSPYILVKLRVYHREKDKKISAIKYVHTNNIYIDFNSPLLIQPVYFNLPGSDVKRILPEEWGRTIFIKPTGGK